MRFTAALVLLICMAGFMLAGLPPPIAVTFLAIAFACLSFVALRRLLETSRRAIPKRFKGPYRIYSSAYDVELRADELPAFLATQKQYVFEEPTPVELLGPWMDALESAVKATANQIGEATNVCVTLLLDQSGSLRGKDSCILATAAGAASRVLHAAKISHEVLAFTTMSWRGGQSRKRWLANGSPRFPGRLCDLLHIVYRSSDETEPLSTSVVRQMTDDRLLKENVDGEAVLWAAARLRSMTAERRILLVVSDGASVDDSTLMTNGPNILEDHLRLVVGDIVRASDIEIYGLGLHYRMFRHYPQYAIIDTAEDIGTVFLPVLAAIVTSNAHRPLSA